MGSRSTGATPNYAEGLRSYMESQQKVAKELAERVKGDADKTYAWLRSPLSKSPEAEPAITTLVSRLAERAHNTRSLPSHTEPKRNPSPMNESKS